MNFKKVLSKTLVIVCLFALVATNVAAGELQKAPVNPEFLKYLSDRVQGLVQYFTADGHRLGYIPAPLKIPNIGPAPSLEAAAALPTSYDLRAHAGVTSVRDQGDCGSCWTFATYGSLESYLKFKASSTRNFAEQDMNKNHGFSWLECDGGNHWMSAAYLAKWRGPFNETDVPYPYDLINTAMAVTAATVQKHIQNVWFLPDRTSKTDNAAIKQAIMDNGALYTAFYYNSNYYNAAKGSYCYLGSASSNHAVTIIGWNDAYAKSNFKSVPAGNGAFLIKNSWGTGWGNSGYFWLSYYDKSLCDFAQFLNAEPTTALIKIYQYDPLGWVNSWGYGDTVAYGANIFTAGTAANYNKIKAVSFYTPVPNATVSISIYKGTTGTNPKSGTKVGTTITKTIAHAGYNTVKFATPYVVTAGKKFSVVIKFTTPGYTYPVPVEDLQTGYTDSATASNAQGFISHGGTSWIDANVYDPKTSVCIKAFAGI